MPVLTLPQVMKTLRREKDRTALPAFKSPVACCAPCALKFLILQWMGFMCSRLSFTAAPMEATKEMDTSCNGRSHVLEGGREGRKHHSLRTWFTGRDSEPINQNWKQNKFELRSIWCVQLATAKEKVDMYTWNAAYTARYAAHAVQYCCLAYAIACTSLHTPGFCVCRDPYFLSPTNEGFERSSISPRW